MVWWENTREKVIYGRDEISAFLLNFTTFFLAFTFTFTYSLSLTRSFSVLKEKTGVLLCVCVRLHLYLLLLGGFAFTFFFCTTGLAWLKKKKKRRRRFEVQTADFWDLPNWRLLLLLLLSTMTANCKQNIVNCCVQWKPPRQQSIKLGFHFNFACFQV